MVVTVVGVIYDAGDDIEGIGICIKRAQIDEENVIGAGVLTDRDELGAVANLGTDVKAHIHQVLDKDGHHIVYGHQVVASI